MPEAEIVKKHAAIKNRPNTISSLTKDLKKLGVQLGDIILVHSSLSALGWTSGNAVAVIEALRKVVGPAGTIVMPTHTSENSDPTNWQHPPVPESWWEIIKKESPPYDPLITPTRMMGTIAETFRKYPGVLRSNHPQGSFAVLGPYAAEIIKDHQYTPEFGKGSPIDKLYHLNAKIILLGVDHQNNTSLHYAEWKAILPNKPYRKQGTAILEEGRRKWIEYEDIDYNDEDFMKLGKEYENSNLPFSIGKVGIGTAKIFLMKNLVDFAVNWMEKNRALNKSQNN
ncbi:MAG: aminoglycoside N(3)-acetyltransferase [Promethearchaeia archaeon]|nr:MAG: aminoglycoside N(3)-acetyltransferase [Candidatus Lokiarchaeia archaeon]